MANLNQNPTKKKEGAKTPSAEQVVEKKEEVIVEEVKQPEPTVAKKEGVEKYMKVSNTTHRHEGVDYSKGDILELPVGYFELHFKNCASEWVEVK